jgi:hypothetical protein
MKRLYILFIALFMGAGLFRLFNPAVGFIYFEPSYVPPNVTITAKRIDITRRTPLQVEQNFRTEDWVYGIREVKAVHAIDSALQNYDPASDEPTCSFFTSPGAQRYRLCHWVDYGRISVYEVSFNKAGTNIYSQLPISLQQRLSADEINKYVDSFAPASTHGIPVLRSGCC